MSLTIEHDTRDTIYPVGYLGDNHAADRATFWAVYPAITLEHRE